MKRKIYKLLFFKSFMEEKYAIEEKEPRSIFVEYFGNSPMIKVLDVLIEGQMFDYSMSEIARNAGVGWSAFSVVWKKLIEKNIVKETRKIGNAKMFKLNKDNPAVQRLIKFDWELTEIETDKILKEQKEKQSIRA